MYHRHHLLISISLSHVLGLLNLSLAPAHVSDVHQLQQCDCPFVVLRSPLLACISLWVKPTAPESEQLHAS